MVNFAKYNIKNLLIRSVLLFVNLTLRLRILVLETEEFESSYCSSSSWKSRESQSTNGGRVYCAYRSWVCWPARKPGVTVEKREFGWGLGNGEIGRAYQVGSTSGRLEERLAQTRTYCTLCKPFQCKICVHLHHA